MTRARLALVTGLAAAASLACSGKTAAPPRANFRLPVSIAVFHGVTAGDATGKFPFLVVANQGRNDLTLVNAANDIVLDAPILLRPLAIDFPDRPALLAAAPLGDGDGDLQKPDVLVGVAAGTSVLQLVHTWEPANAVDGDAIAGQAVDLGADVLRIVALPTDPLSPGTARLAVALAGRKLAIVQYKRAADGFAVQKDPSFGTNGVLVHGLDFLPADLAVVPGDLQHLYAATLDPIGPSAVLGVAEIDLSAPAEPWPVRALDARGATRLVAAARLQERRNDLPVPGDPGAIDFGPGAFNGQPVVTRVYAVLDEGTCGTDRRIDCGVVILDPEKRRVPPPPTVPPDDDIPDDWAGWMPYRAPIQLRSRPLLLAVSGPPAIAPSDWTFGTSFMRLVLGTTATAATTAVGMAAGENGVIDFLDMGRFKVASTTLVPVSAFTAVSSPTEANRLRIADPSTHLPADSATAASFVHTTPGYAQDDAWTVSFQGALPGLLTRPAEAGPVDTQHLWLAIQYGDGTPGDAGRSLHQVARLFHPDLGVRVGDIVTIQVDSFKVGGVTPSACKGTAPPDTPVDLVDSVPHQFETTITQLLPPSDATPGGAVVLAVRTKGVDEHDPNDPAIPPEWQACFDALVAALPIKGLSVTVNAGRFLLVGNNVGYAGRSELGSEHVLRYKADPSETGLPAFMYQDEDTLAASCPLADWDGAWPAPAPVLTCGGAGCDRDLCEQLVLARKARRRYHLAEDCGTPPDATCATRFAGLTFPIVNGPVVRFEVAHESLPGATTSTLFRGLTLPFSTGSGVGPLAVSAGGATTQANFAITFDRSAPPVGDSYSGYRFYVSYPGDQVADVSPSLTPVASNTVR